MFQYEDTIRDEKNIVELSEDGNTFIFRSDRKYCLHPGQRVMIETGVRFKFDKKYILLIMNDLPYKSFIQVRNKIIDSTFTSEIELYARAEYPIGDSTKRCAHIYIEKNQIIAKGILIKSAFHEVKIIKRDTQREQMLDEENDYNPNL